MACLNGIILDEKNSKICGNDGGKCDLIYEYGINTCQVSNKTTYLELLDCVGKNSIITFGGPNNFLNLSKGNVRIYNKPFHKIIGSNSVIGEVVIHYKYKSNNKNLLLCIPIKHDDTSNMNDFWSFLNHTKPQGTKTAVNINTKNFTLNKLVTNCPFFKYSGNPLFSIADLVCNSKVDIIVLDPRDGNIASINTKYMNLLNTLIKPWTTKSKDPEMGPSDLFYNSHGSEKPGDNPVPSKVRILSNCVETTNVLPPKASKKEKIQKFLWITPIVILGLVLLSLIVYNLIQYINKPQNISPVRNGNNNVISFIIGGIAFVMFSIFLILAGIHHN